MTYFRHLGLNIKVALKGAVLVLFHLAHGLIPIRLTEHMHWRVGFKRKFDDRSQAQDDMLEIVGGALGKKGCELSRWKKQTMRRTRKMEDR